MDSGWKERFRDISRARPIGLEAHEIVDHSSKIGQVAEEGSNIIADAAKTCAINS